MKPRTATALLVVVVCWALMILVTSVNILPRTEQVVLTSDIVPRSGLSYTVRLQMQVPSPLFEFRPDSNAFPYDSNLIVYEDGKPLGPQHTRHDLIAELGMGRYSHWGDPNDSSVVFSTSDGSDPRTNGHNYSFEARAQLPNFVVWATFFTSLIVTIIAVLRLPRPWLAATVWLAVTSLVAWAWLAWGHVSIATDSGKYVNWSPLVPLGYSFFLAAVEAIGGSLSWTGVAQMAVLIGGSSYLAFATYRLFDRPVLAFVSLFALLLYTPIFAQGLYILTEPLFTALILVNVAAGFRLIERVNPRDGILVAASAAAIMFVRPAGYFAPLGILFLILACHGSARRLVLWALLPFLAFSALTVLANGLVRDTAAQSQVGRVLLAHVAFLFDPDFVNEKDREYARLIDAALEPHRAEYLSLTSDEERFSFLTDDYNARLRSMDRAIANVLVEEIDPSLAMDIRLRQTAVFYRLDALYTDFALATIRSRPLDYGLLVAGQVLGAWRLFVLGNQGGYVSALYQYLALDHLKTNLDLVAESSLPLTEADVTLDARRWMAFPGIFAEWFDNIMVALQKQRLIVLTIGAISLLAIPIAIFFRHRSRHWLALGYCGVMIHGSVILTAASTVFIPRYALPIDPLILLSGVLIIDGIVVWTIAQARSLPTRKGALP